MVKYTKKNLDIANKFCQSLGPSSYRGSMYQERLSPTSDLRHFRDFILQYRTTWGIFMRSYLISSWMRKGRGCWRGGKIFLYLGRRQWHQSPTKLSEGAALTGKWTCYQTEETDRNASERTEWSHCKNNKFGVRVKRRNDEIPVSWPSRETLKVSVILNCANKRET